MLGFIVIYLLAGLLVCLIIKVEDKLLKAFFALILVGGIVYLVWTKPDYFYDFVREHKTLTIVLDVMIGLGVLLWTKDSNQDTNSDDESTT